MTITNSQLRAIYERAYDAYDDGADPYQLVDVVLGMLNVQVNG